MGGGVQLTEHPAGLFVDKAAVSSLHLAIPSNAWLFSEAAAWAEGPIMFVERGCHRLGRRFVSKASPTS